MALPPGTRLGPYEVVSPLGAGGMGEVYRARDTKLGRDVALKVLPEGALTDDEARRRFRKEADALARLAHPHIATIHDFDSANGTDFLVMELVRGPSLRDKLEEKGALPEKTVVRLGTQLARGLQAAHEEGIVHRDLKPSNVQLTPDGLVKILDFGLAQLLPREAAEEETAPTETAIGKAAGTLLYMSPEQLRGRGVDARTDLYAAGAVLYEMATGQRLFSKPSTAELTEAILNDEPRPPRELKEQISPGLEAVILKALDKDPELRHQTAKDLLVDLERLQQRTRSSGRVAAQTSGSGPTVPRATGALGTSPGEREGGDDVSPAKGSWARAHLIPWAIAAVAALVAVITLWRVQPSPSAQAPPAVTRLVVSLPADEVLNTALDQPIALSPDGRRLVYTAQDDRGTRLYARALDQFDAREIPGTEGGKYPFFSPSGEWVGFFTSGQLKKVAVAGGDPQPICDAFPVPLGATWGAGDTIVFGSKEPGGLWKVSADGGTVEPLTTVDAESGETTHSSPHILPDGETVLFTVVADGQTAIDAVSLAGEGRRRLDEVGVAEGPRYASSGHLVFARGTALWAVAFDPERLEVMGAPFFVSGNVESRDQLGERRAVFALSASGSLAYVPVRPDDVMGWVDRDGHFAAVLEGTALGLPRLSPDDSRVAVSVDKGEGLDVWLLDPERGTFTPLAVEGANIEPIWTPDGKRVTFTSDRSGGAMALFEKAVDGNGDPVLLHQPAGRNTPFAGSWSPDGEVLAFYERSAKGVRDIWLLPRGGEPVAIVNTPANEHSPMFSPNGRWLAYVSDTTGQEEVYVRDREGSGPPWQVSQGGGSEPLWSPDGRELFYRSGDRVMTVAVTTEPSFSPSRPELLFEGAYMRNPDAGGLNYAVTSDGKRFLFVVRQEPLEIRVVVNWVAELSHVASEK
jgi:Tol biopolymer transport system component